MSKFLAQWFSKLAADSPELFSPSLFVSGSVFAEKVNWTKVSRDNSRYIELGRLPKDPAGRTIQLMNPTAMTDDSFNLLWDHLHKSTRGQLADDVRFLWRGEDLHFNLPTVQPPADPSVHVAGEQAAKTNVGKRKRGAGKKPSKKGERSRNKRKLDDEAIVDDDLDELFDAPEPTKPPNVGRTSTRALRPRKTATEAQKAPESDQESSVSGSDDEFTPEDEDVREHIDLGAFAMDDDEATDEGDNERGLEGGEEGREDSSEAKHGGLSPANGLSGGDDVVGMEVDLLVVGTAESKHPVDSCVDVEKRNRASGGENSAEKEEGVDSKSSGLAEEAALLAGFSPEETGDQDCDGADWGPRSSSAVSADLPLVEISLAAPSSDRGLESPAWVRVSV